MVPAGDNKGACIVAGVRFGVLVGVDDRSCIADAPAFGEAKPMRNEWKLDLAEWAPRRAACSRSSRRWLTVAWDMGRKVAALSKNSGVWWRRATRQGKRSLRR